MKKPQFQNYAAYVEHMKSLPRHQQWVTFVSGKTSKMIVHNSPLAELEGLGAELGLDENGGLYAYMNVSDTFMYACADSEGMEPYEVLLVGQANRRFGYNGVTEWAARKRGHRPIGPAETGISDSDWSDFLADLDALVRAIDRDPFPWWHEPEPQQERGG